MPGALAARAGGEVTASQVGGHRSAAERNGLLRGIVARALALLRSPAVEPSERPPAGRRAEPSRSACPDGETPRRRHPGDRIATATASPWNGYDVHAPAFAPVHGSRAAMALEAAPVAGCMREARSRPRAGPGFWARLARGLATARMRQAEREIAAYRGAP